jgi:transposase
MSWIQSIYSEEVWEEARVAIEEGGTSYREVAKRYGMSLGSLSARSARDGWVGKRAVGSRKTVEECALKVAAVGAAVKEIEEKKGSIRDADGCSVVEVVSSGEVNKGLVTDKVEGRVEDLGEVKKEIESVAGAGLVRVEVEAVKEVGVELASYGERMRMVGLRTKRKIAELTEQTLKEVEEGELSARERASVLRDLATVGRLLHRWDREGPEEAAERARRGVINLDLIQRAPELLSGPSTRGEERVG